MTEIHFKSIFHIYIFIRVVLTANSLIHGDVMCNTNRSKYETGLLGLYQTIASRQLVTSARHVGLSRLLVTLACHVGSSRSAVQYLFTPINAMLVRAVALSWLHIGDLHRHRHNLTLLRNRRPN